MKEDSENKLAEILDKLINGTDQGADFMSQQLPDYLEHLLMWFGIYYGVMCILGIFVIFTSVYLTKILSKKLPAKPKKGEPSNWAYDSREHFDANLSLVGFLAALVYFFTFIFSIMLGLCIINIQWLQIIIAPKVWLVEYISKLV